MQVLCLGDIAIADKCMSNGAWQPPIELNPSEETRILFNWELPIGDKIVTIPRSSGPRILTAPNSSIMIKRWAPGFAALATNHILDGGQEGLVNTITSLQREGFFTIGAGITLDEITKPLFWRTREGVLAVVNWVFPETHPDWMSIPGPNCWPGIEQARKIIKDLNDKADWILVFAHWSDELFSYPRPEDRVIARELADAGADVLVSHHPHVVRGMEIIGDCRVFYSLGNFYFSDFLDASGTWIVKQASRNREALGVHISFERGKKPTYKTISFRQLGDRVIIDSYNQAARRMRHSSKPLNRFQGREYLDWYRANRIRFDKYWVRWHFGVRRLNIRGLLQRLLRIYN